MRIERTICDDREEGWDDECDSDVAEKSVGGDAGYVATEFASYDSCSSGGRTDDADHNALSNNGVEWSNEKIDSNSPNDFDSEKIEMR